MGKKMNFHLEGLQSTQIEVLKQMSPFMQERGFYLAGGTALSVYFGHRSSVDLDWFTSNPIDDGQLLAQELRKTRLDFLAQQTGPGTLHGYVLDVRVSFLEFRYPLLHAPVFWEETNCSLASLEDLACMKLSAIAQRGARKDFCDIYALGKEQFTLKEMLDFYARKFNQDVSPVLYGLVYFDDAESERMPEMVWDVKWVEIKKAIQGWVKELTKST
jgi:predicted nucleotidyltransferase component of viral defense system